MKNRHGFTLVELLVVITIIIALLAILLPSLSAAVASAHRAACASNTRQLTQACLTYAGSNNRRIPPEARNMNSLANLAPDKFRGDLFAHLNLGDELWQCPSDPRPLGEDTTDNRGSMYGWTMGSPWNNSRDVPNMLVGYLYLANTYNVDPPGSYVRDIDRLPRGLVSTGAGYAPTDQPLFSDQIKYFAQMNQWLINHRRADAEDRAEGANQSFLDGSAAWLAAAPADKAGGSYQWMRGRLPDPLAPDPYGAGNAELMHDTAGVYGHWWF